MPSSITLSNISWSTPDGRPLFSNIDLSFGTERAGLVGRNGVGKSTLLKLVSGNLTPTGGSVAVNGRIGVLRQAIQVRPDETVADLFGITDALALLARAEAGEASAEQLADADWTLENRLEAALAGLHLDLKATTPLASLSGGQQTRVALAALVFSEPDFLLLDEPTNNLDREGRHAVADLLGRWKAGAVVVSHDRELLDRMDAIVEMTSLGATRYGGNWSHYRERKTVELSAARHDLAEAEKQVADAARKAQDNAERQARRDKAGRKKAARGDIPKILLGGMKERAENTGAGNIHLAERQRIEAQEAATAARERIEVLQPLTVSVAPTGLPPHRIVMRATDLNFNYPGAEPVIRNLSFSVVGPERVAISGINGSGKTTLLRLIAGRLQPSSGTVSILTEHAMLDQHVSLLDPAMTIRDNFRRINPEADENACRAALARFMFRADAALQVVDTLSGGQLLRVGLACVLGVSPPALLILDEPTNHLDIDSIESVEAGLRAYDGALVVISHDETFLRSIGIRRRIRLQKGGIYSLLSE